MSNKRILKSLLKISSKQPPLSEDWGEGEDMPEGIDRQIRMKLDNFKGGPRWHPSQNEYIKMTRRGDVHVQ